MSWRWLYCLWLCSDSFDLIFVGRRRQFLKRHSRESGNPAVLPRGLDSRFRGNDKLGLNDAQLWDQRVIHSRS